MTQVQPQAKPKKIIKTERERHIESFMIGNNLTREAAIREVGKVMSHGQKFMLNGVECTLY